MDKPYDFVLAGGGLAGLTLAYHLAQSPLRDKTMLIVDRDAKDRNDRTWCFWTDQPTLFDGIIHRSWSQIRFAGAGQDRVTPLARYRYQMIRGLDLYEFVRNALARLPNVTFLRGRVERIEDGPEGARVAVDGRIHLGRWVFDSRFRLPSAESDGRRYLHLRQCFRGWQVETQEDAFDPRTPTFMDFRTAQKAGTRFFYVLPLSDREALVECVTLGALDDDSALREYLGTVLGIKSYRMLPVEGGASPLTDQPFQRRAGASIMNIGVLGGMIKPSTGYAFQRIQQDSRAIVASLLRAGDPFGVPGGSRYYRLCDATLLQIMAHQGHRLETILSALFQNNPIERVLRFLDEAATPLENLLVMASLPPTVFTPAMLQVLVRGWRAGPAGGTSAG
jgi:lycopene beta-cyclase